VAGIHTPDSGEIVKGPIRRWFSCIGDPPPARLVDPAAVPDRPVAWDPTIRFADPASVPRKPVAGEQTIRFVNPASVPRKPVAGEQTIRFVKRDLPCRQITETREYRYDDIRPDDIVIDIGANVGAFCLRAAKLSGRVLAVEPVTWEILEENIRLNQARVKVIRGALGDGNPGQVTWDGITATVPTYTLRQIVSMAGGCDFLKCDCEGGEWLIRPEDLAGIRRIEMELHLPPIGGRPSGELLEYIGRNYAFEIDRMPGHDVLGVMGILHAEQKRA